MRAAARGMMYRATPAAALEMRQLRSFSGAKMSATARNRALWLSVIKAPVAKQQSVAAEPGFRASLKPQNNAGRGRLGDVQSCCGSDWQSGQVEAVNSEAGC